MKKSFPGITAVFLIFAAFSASCSTLGSNQSPEGGVITSTAQISTETPTEQATETPTPSIPTSTATPSPTLQDQTVFDQVVTIDFNQNPAMISTVDPSDDQYIYRDAMVTFDLGEFPNERRYLNLDDLTNNGFSNSDIMLFATTGNKTFYDLYTTNNARYYYSGESSMDYTSCIDHFPLSGFNSSTYNGQAAEIASGNPYCVLTNEGHLAMINVVKDSTSKNEYGMINLSFVVTVYSQIVTNAYTPMPTETPGPSPTANPNSNLNLPTFEAKVHETAPQDFLDALAAKDETAISQMMDYPILVSTGDDFNFTVYTPEEFFQFYNLFFSELPPSILLLATVNDNGADAGGGVSLSIVDFQILFNSHGRISEISYSGD